MVQCAAKSKRSGEQCKRHAMHGKRVCHMHGGKSLSGAASPSFVSGRYSKALAKHPDVQAYYEAYRDDPRLMETLNEVALLRGKLAWYLEDFGAVNHPDALAVVKEYTEAITKQVERRHKMLYGEKVTISSDDYRNFTARVYELVKEHYGDDERFDAFADAVSGLYSNRGSGQGEAAESA